jgi:hypothetical protein
MIAILQEKRSVKASLVLGEVAMGSTVKSKRYIVKSLTACCGCNRVCEGEVNEGCVGSSADASGGCAG